MTLAEFLVWEERQELRYEFDGVEPVAMAGGSLAHAAIQRNLALAVGTRLRGKPCQFFGSDLKTQAAENSSRCPDGMVICSGLDPALKIVRNPVVVFEVLSPSTPAVDRIVKARESQATPSVQRCDDGRGDPRARCPIVPQRLPRLFSLVASCGPFDPLSLVGLQDDAEFSFIVFPAMVRVYWR
jgi:Putative restriction endonuclease